MTQGALSFYIIMEDVPRCIIVYGGRPKANYCLWRTSQGALSFYIIMEDVPRCIIVYGGCPKVHYHYHFMYGGRPKVHYHFTYGGRPMDYSEIWGAGAL